MLVFDVFVAVVLLGNVMHIGMYLLRGGVVIGPLGVRRKAVRIVVSWNIAFTLRAVSIVRLRKMNQCHVTPGYLFSRHISI
jgi:hypothetical protein